MRERTRTGVVLAALLAMPVALGIVYLVLAATGIVGAGAAGPTAVPLLDVLSSADTWRSLSWSVYIAAVSTVLATIIAVIVGALFRGTGTTDRVARALALLPLPVPHVVAGLLGVQLFAGSGWIARVAHAAGAIAVPADMPALIYDTLGIGLIVTMTWKEAPFLSAVAIALLSMRGTTAEEAARTLGASAARTLRLITIPLLLRGMMPAIVAVFVFVFGNFEVAVLLAPSDPLALPLLIEERALEPDLAQRAGAHVAALLAFAVAIVAVVMHGRARTDASAAP
ncbi:MAG: ABC transporter permease subunit [Gemmatimonas sp.]